MTRSWERAQRETTHLLAAAIAALSVSCGKSEAPTQPARTRAAIGLTPGSEGAQYAYDAAGNVLRISSATAVAVSIADFSPRSGGAGQIVTVSGAGFSPTPSLNAVQLGGSSAAVISATSSELTFAVPTGATTGAISVTTDGTTATSADVFTVVTALAIADFEPKLGVAGTVLTISGYNFDPDPARNSVTIGGGAGAVTSATVNSMLAVVGPASTSGKVRVATGSGQATSAQDFFLVPTSYSAWDVAFLARAAPDASTSVPISEAGKIGLVLFDGSAGDRVTLFVDGITFRTVNLTIYAPDGSSFHNVTGLAPSQQYKLEPQVLPESGTYTIAIQPAMDSTGKLDLKVLQEASGALQPGTTSSISLERGQNGRVTLTGEAGQSFGLACTAVSTDPASAMVNLHLYRPDGPLLWAVQVSSPTSWQLPPLPLTGTYTMRVMPSGATAASMTLLLSQPNFGTVLVDGPSVQFQNTAPGQAGKFTFVGTAGDLLALGAPSISLAPAGSSVNFKVQKPDGTVLSNSNPMTTPFSQQLPQLPATGAYTISVEPAGTAVGSVTFLLSRPITGVLPTDGSPTVHQTTRAGQTGRYAFTGSAGERYTFRATASASFPNGVAVFVYAPSGATVASAQLYSNYDSKIDLGALPASGTYTVALVPGRVDVGQVTMRLLSVATDTLVIGDPPKTLALGAAQNGRYTFAATAGEWLGLAATTLATVPANGAVSLTIYKPDGTPMWSTSSPYPTSWQLPQIPTTGTYTLLVQPPGTASASLSLLLSGALAGALGTDGTATRFETARPGQSGRYTFTATAGQRFTMQVTAGPNLVSGASVGVYQPNGASVGWAQPTSNSDLKVDLGALPASGTYTAIVTPNGLTTGRVDLRLVGVATDTLVIGDPAKALTLGAAQNGRYTFAATAGDWIGLAASTLATTPANGAVSLTIYKPDGAWLWSTSSSHPTSWQLPQIPTTGTYTLLVQPPGTASASLSLLLSRALAGALETDGTAMRFETTRPGQSGRYTFTATAGQRFTMQVTAGPNLVSGASVAVNQPNGASVGWAQPTSNSDLKVDLGALPASGTYTAIVTPNGLTTGRVDLRLLAVATDTLVIGDPPKTLTLNAAQNGRYTFAASAGDLLSLSVAALTTTPTSTYVSFTLYRPDGGAVWSAGAYPQPAVTWPLPQLPASGTYSVAVQPQGTPAATFSIQLPRR